MSVNERNRKSRFEVELEEDGLEDRAGWRQVCSTSGPCQFAISLSTIPLHELMFLKCDQK